MCAVDLEMQASAPAQASPYRIQHRAGDARQNPYRGASFLPMGSSTEGQITVVSSGILALLFNRYSCRVNIPRYTERMVLSVPGMYGLRLTYM